VHIVGKHSEGRCIRRAAGERVPDLGLEATFLGCHLRDAPKTVPRQLGLHVLVSCHASREPRQTYCSDEKGGAQNIACSYGKRNVAPLRMITRKGTTLCAAPSGAHHLLRYRFYKDFAPNGAENPFAKSSPQAKHIFGRFRKRSRLLAPRF